MFRVITEDLLKWRNSLLHKPLIIRGARQVGKTTTIKEFGRNNFDNTVYIDFFKQKSFHKLFDGDLDIKKILTNIEAIYNITINENTLIFFDEIQECPNAFMSLKYFAEDMPKLYVVAAGSTLGIKIDKVFSFPVGKVDILNMYPMSFREFLMNTNKKLYDLSLSFSKATKINDVIHNEFIECYRYYLVVGGMPECVNIWITANNIDEVTQKQMILLEEYKNDFSKHCGKISETKIIQTFESLKSQFSKEYKKFKYANINKNAKAREYSESLNWLVSAGLFIRVNNVSKIGYPLSAYEVKDSFKIYLFDVGLLKAMMHIDNRAILTKMDFDFNGIIAENFVATQSLVEKFDSVHYFNINQIIDIDFTYQFNMKNVVIEVKSGENIKSKSLSKYHQEHAAEKNIIVRYSLKNYVVQDWLINIPLYLIFITNQIVV